MKRSKELVRGTCRYEKGRRILNFSSCSHNELENAALGNGLEHGMDLRDVEMNLNCS
jgi:hypothetical protein